MTAIVRKIDTINTISVICTDRGLLLPTNAPEQPKAWSLRLVGEFVQWFEKRRQRKALRDLTDDQLQDIGLSRSDVDREVAKSFFWN